MRAPCVVQRGDAVRACMLYLHVTATRQAGETPLDKARDDATRAALAGAAA
jgi:hypothetical protein